MTGIAYDADNRLTAANNEQYGYAPSNQRVWLRKSGGAVEHFTFYGVDGARLGVYSKGTYNLPLTGSYFAVVKQEVYFAGKRIRSGGLAVAEDRLGSTRREDTTASRYYPYGEEFTPTTAEDRQKFGTYYRDAGTGLDYADQRHYSNSIGRFLTPDPYEAGAGLGDPQSWNRYVYVQGDPINFNDPTGQVMANVEGGGGGVPFFGLLWVVNVFRSIFGGGPPKNPVVEAWKRNPAAEVAAWDRKIADTLKEGEKQDKRFLKALKVVGDCYQRHALSGTMIRRFEYQPIDQFDQPFARGEVTVSELVVVVQGGSVVGGGCGILPARILAAPFMITSANRILRLMTLLNIKRFLARS